MLCIANIGTILKSANAIIVGFSERSKRRIRMAESIRIDPSAYDILEVHRRYLRKTKGMSGASFSDAIRHMQDCIEKPPPS